MKVSYHWLTEYFDEDLPAPEELAEILTMHAYEVEDLKQAGEYIILDIDVLPNRAADSLSHLGIAREAGTLLNVSVDDPLPTPNTKKGISSADHINLAIESEYVRRATKRLVIDVEVQESPSEIQQRLQALGHQPINNIVDITNYVMLATGQPVHAFDYDKVAGEAPKEVVVREAEAGETITTLDENEYELEEGMLVIADEKKPLDIAGIKGGLNSHIDEDTERVMLSVCSFNPSKIRKTSQALNLRTDASKRFENDISPKMVGEAVEYLSALIQEHAGGRVTQDICDEYPKEPNRYVTGVSVEQANALLGTDIKEQEAQKILGRCYCDVASVYPPEQVVEHARSFEGTPYKRGASVSFDAPEKFDCSSFVAYLFARYGGVSIPRMSVDQYVYGTAVAEEDMKPGDVVFANTGEGDIHYKAKEFMPGTEVPDGVDHCGVYLGDGEIMHATSAAGEVVVEPLGQSNQFENIVGIRRMAAGERLRAEIPHWRRDLRSSEDLIEEIGRVHGYENIEQTNPGEVHEETPTHKTFFYTQKTRDILTAAGFSEVYTYAFQLEGEIELQNPIANDKGYVRSSLKSGLEDALDKNTNHKELLDGEEVQLFEIGKVFQDEEGGERLELGLASSGNRDGLVSTLSYLGEQLGVEGISDQVKDISDDQVLLVDIAEIIDELPEPESYQELDEVNIDTTYEEFSRYPYVLRDIAFWCPQEITDDKSEVTKLLQETAEDLLVNIKLFDEYDPDDQDRVSLAYRLVFQSDERTLSAEEVNELMEEIYEAVAEKGWEVR